MVILDQQAGGYVMHYPHVVGAVLRLAANTAAARQPLAPLIRGFEAMAEDPDLTLLASDYPDLYALVATWGDPYTPEQLARFTAAVSAFVHIPPVRRGIEAFIEFEPVDLHPYVGDWCVMTCALADASLWDELSAEAQRYGYLSDDSNLSELLITDDARFDETTVQTLHALGHALGRMEPPRMYFLWENSD